MRLSSTSLILLPSLALASQSDDSLDSLPSDQVTRIPSQTPSPLQPSLQEIWIPIATLPYIAAQTIAVTPDQTIEEADDHELKREVVNGAASAQAATVTQVSPITTITEYQTINGVVQAVPVVYTQTFASVPDQWAAPSSGSIGLGTIQGTVGVTRSKRDAAPEPTAVQKSEKRQEEGPELVRRESSGASTVSKGTAGASSIFALAVAVAVMIAF